MKKFAILFGLIVSVATLVGCASKCAPTQNAAAETALNHHDFKGEVGSK